MFQTIAECQRRENDLKTKKETLEAEKKQLLESVHAETQDLQEEKEELQISLAELKKRVDETEGLVSILDETK